MPRKLPKLDLKISQDINFAIEYTKRIEFAKTIGGGQAASISLMHVEFVYELAFLRIFISWEHFLESCFHRLLCGYGHSAGLEPLQPGKTYATTLSDAESTILGARDYILWHNPQHVIRRAQSYFHNGRFELLISSMYTKLEYFSAIRHRIAHAQNHAQHQFDAATMHLAGKRYRGSRPGRFLRDWAPGLHQQPVRWLESISRDLESLAQQVCN